MASSSVISAGSGFAENASCQSTRVPAIATFRRTSRSGKGVQDATYLLRGSRDATTWSADATWNSAMSAGLTGRISTMNVKSAPTWSPSNNSLMKSLGGGVAEMEANSVRDLSGDPFPPRPGHHHRLIPGGSGCRNCPWFLLRTRPHHRGNLATAGLPGLPDLSSVAGSRGHHGFLRLTLLWNIHRGGGTEGVLAHNSAGTVPVPNREQQRRSIRGRLV